LLEIFLKFVKLLVSWKFALICGALLCLLAAASSFINYSKAHIIYDSALFILLWVLFSLSLTLYLVRLLRRRKDLYQYSLIILHSGILIVLIGVTANRIGGFDGIIYLLEGRPQTVFLYYDDTEGELGFTVRCDDFKAEYYENSTRAKTYKTLLTVIDGDNTLSSTEINVNRSFTYKGVSFYQNSFGIYPNPDGRLLFASVLNGIRQEHRVIFNEEIELDEETTVKIVDFSPALAFKNDGTYYTFSKEVMYNPAAFFEINRLGDIFFQWVTVRKPASGVIDDDFSLIFHDFWGVEYTVLSVAKKPFTFVLYIGFVFIAAGFVLIYLPRIRN